MGGIPKPFVEQTKMFAETALMVRKPALEIINSLKLTDYKKPAVRYLLCILLVVKHGCNNFKTILFMIFIVYM